MLKAGQRVLVLNAPPNYLDSLGDLPNGARLVANTTKEPDVIQVFVSSLAELRDSLPALRSRLKEDGALWVTYPKGGRSSGAESDINRDIIREFAGTIGLQAVALFSVDTKWSALRLKKSG